MNMKFDNQRKFQTISFDGKAYLKFANHSYDSCQIKHLCLTGFFIKGDFLKCRARNCSVQIFHTDEHGNNSLKASAKVILQNDKGIGLNFTEMTFENYLLLQTILINKSKSPEIILRELPNNSPFFISD